MFAKLFKDKNCCFHGSKYGQLMSVLHLFCKFLIGGKASRCIIGQYHNELTLSVLRTYPDFLHFTTSA